MLVLALALVLVLLALDFGTESFELDDLVLLPVPREGGFKFNSSLLVLDRKGCARGAFFVSFGLSIERREGREVRCTNDEGVRAKPGERRTRERGGCVSVKGRGGGGIDLDLLFYLCSQDEFGSTLQPTIAHGEEASTVTKRCSSHIHFKEMPPCTTVLVHVLY